MKNSKKIIYLPGIAALFLISACSFIAAIFYRGTKGEPYSVFNHFISELGQGGVSQLAPLFNAGLIFGGILLLAFMIGLALYVNKPWYYAIFALGAFSTISCSLVGVFPMNHLAIHIKVANDFFHGILTTIFLFTISTVIAKNGKFSKWIALPGILAVLCVAVFLIVPRYTNTNHIWTLDPSKIVRPEYWPNAYLEWSVFFSVLLWVLVVSLYMLKRAGPDK